eukprot:1606379-Rhodomonas_salina.2
MSSRCQWHASRHESRRRSIAASCRTVLVVVLAIGSGVTGFPGYGVRLLTARQYNKSSPSVWVRLDRLPSGTSVPVYPGSLLGASHQTGRAIQGGSLQNWVGRVDNA